MITGGITDSDIVRENSAVLVFPESIAEALFDKVRLVSGVEFLCDLALEVGVCGELDSPQGYPLCVDSEPVCACVVLSELICTSALLSNSSFLNDVKISGISVRLCTLEDAASL
jgi:hypothetical protein